MSEFAWPVRVYYEDTDRGGVVYYANYLRFMERARTEYLRSLGFEQDDLIESQGIIFAVRSACVDYLRPARFNDLLKVTARVSEAGKASLMFEQTITKEGEASGILCQGQIRIACLDHATFRPTPIPTNIVAELMNDR